MMSPLIRKVAFDILVGKTGSKNTLLRCNAQSAFVAHRFVSISHVSRKRSPTENIFEKNCCRRPQRAVSTNVSRDAITLNRGRFPHSSGKKNGERRHAPRSE